MDEEIYEKNFTPSSCSDDLEARPMLEKPWMSDRSSKLAPEYGVGMRVKLAHLVAYFILNLWLTLYNKAILNLFAFPWLLTGIHSSFTMIGCLVLLKRRHLELAELTKSDYIQLVAFSSLFTINIAMSNVSLGLVSVPFHQIMRSTTPVFTVLIHRLVIARTYESSTYLSLALLVAGVGLTTFGDYTFSYLGFVCTLLGAVLAAVKAIATNQLMTGPLALSPLELLLRLSPLAACQSIVISIFSGEASQAVSWAYEGNIGIPTMLFLIGNGFMASMLNISSFQTNKVAGALTMTVCGNMKQCFTVVLGIVLFSVQTNVTSEIGMLVALIGAAWYSNVELRKKITKPILDIHPIHHDVR